MNNLENILYIISTPIGNLNDISLRAKETLKNVEFIICENPKHSLKLLNKLGIKKKLFALHDYNEKKLIKKIDKYAGSYPIALISDAGAPLISDPGFNLVKDFIKKDIGITGVPGPSSVISSIQLSGLPTNNFIFFGFVPKNINAAKLIVKRASEIGLTSIFYISGNRLKKFLEILVKNSQNPKIAVCKELTKKNEAIFRDNLKNIIKKITKKEINLKGEFTLVLDFINNNSKKTINDAIKTQILKLLKKYTLTETVEIVHKLSSISKKDIYQMSLKLKNE